MLPIHFNKTASLIDIRRDSVFKAVFTKDCPESRRALECLISAVTGRDMTVLSIAANEPPVDSLRDKQARFDISCKTLAGELVNVEMTLSPDQYEPARLEYYSGKLFSSQDIRGKPYSHLRRTYQIAFLSEGRIFKDGEYLHNFEYYDCGRGMPLGGKTRIITVELAKLEQTVEKSTSEMTKTEMWAVFFRYITDTSKCDKINTILETEEGIAMANQVLMTISRDEEEHARYMSRFKFEADLQSRIAGAREDGERKGRRTGIRAGRQEGILVGRQEGILTGRQEGILTGRQEGILTGRQEGEYKKALEIARNLKVSGIPVEKIADVTGLSHEVIAGL
ncbi:MAG: Rpn family recombination-promoting nuclease/putative transposase [Spirochaetaceae bacterium]|jgi:predicted transposase/invertase (TIGR01784 family)|nr:Rpn family recombination-promoting nuclease/putative transposase [Spirochaetaceae bacterium]